MSSAIDEVMINCLSFFDCKLAKTHWRQWRTIGVTDDIKRHMEQRVQKIGFLKRIGDYWHVTETGMEFVRQQDPALVDVLMRSREIKFEELRARHRKSEEEKQRRKLIERINRQGPTFGSW